jgi:hypothetical protein
VAGKRWKIKISCADTWTGPCNLPPHFWGLILLRCGMATIRNLPSGVSLMKDFCSCGIIFFDMAESDCLKWVLNSTGVFSVNYLNKWVRWYYAYIYTAIWHSPIPPYIHAFLKRQQSYHYRQPKQARAVWMTRLVFSVQVKSPSTAHISEFKVRWPGMIVIK